MEDGARDQKVEALIAENAQEALRLRLHRMTSATICQRMLDARHPALSIEARKAKAEGVASALRSALGYWEGSSAALNAKILAQYYFALQLSIAEQVANGEAASTLEAIQKHTEEGHGLATLRPPDLKFPENYYVSVLKSGHFPAYCKSIGVDVVKIALESKVRSWSKVTTEQMPRFVSLADLLRRIPELRPVIHECLGVAPLSFHIVSSSKNLENMQAAIMRQSVGDGQASAAEGSTKTTYVTFATSFGGGQGITPEYLAALDLPIDDIRFERSEVRNRSEIVGELNHPLSEHWAKRLSLYHSQTGTSLIAPLWGHIVDPFIIHFMTLYALSIVVRYLPSVWYEIEHGPLDHIRALLEQYVAIVDVALPKMGVERIAGVRMNVIYPGSLLSPI